MKDEFNFSFSLSVVLFIYLFLNLGQTQNDGERPPWNHRTAVPSQDFDEWFNMQHRQPRTADQDVRAYQGSR